MRAAVAAVVAAAALAVTAAAATAAPTIPDCFAQVVAPKTIVLACADGNLSLDDANRTLYETSVAVS